MLGAKKNRRIRLTPVAWDDSLRRNHWLERRRPYNPASAILGGVSIVMALGEEKKKDTCYGGRGELLFFFFKAPSSHEELP